LEDESGDKVDEADDDEDEPLNSGDDQSDDEDLDTLFDADNVKKKFNSKSTLILRLWFVNLRRSTGQGTNGNSI
jgi:hypothetical protein